MLAEEAILALNGSEAVALAVKQCKVNLIAAYPITPQTIIVERLSEYVANGEMDAEFLNVESEHSALSACVGGSLVGGRAFTATASQGLALMHEVLYLASGLRCPIVMAVANRALSAPINIHGDHSDMMGSRDCGWVQLYAKNAQEAYDLTILAFRLAEDHRVLLPVAVNMDGYVVTHSLEAVQVLEDAEVDRFLPPREPAYKLDPANPVTVGGLALPDYYYEFKRQQEEAMRGVPGAFKEIADDFYRISGRRYGVIEGYGLEDAEAALVCLGSTAGTAASVAKRLRGQGERVGVLRILLYRPFPMSEVASALRGVKAVAVLEKSLSFGAPFGALASDLVAALYRSGTSKPVIDVMHGLGGRDTAPDELAQAFNLALASARGEEIKEPITFLGVRE